MQLIARFDTGDVRVFAVNPLGFKRSRSVTKMMKKEVATRIICSALPQLENARLVCRGRDRDRERKEREKIKREIMRFGNRQSFTFDR